MEETISLSTLTLWRQWLLLFEFTSWLAWKTQCQATFCRLGFSCVWAQAICRTLTEACLSDPLNHQRFSVVAIFVPDFGGKFTVLWGLPFGLESTVVAFNRFRFSLLSVAIARRCTLSLSAAEAIANSHVSQVGTRQVLQLTGSPPQPEKSCKPTCKRHWAPPCTLAMSWSSASSASNPKPPLQLRSWPSWTSASTPTSCPERMPQVAR